MVQRTLKWVAYAKNPLSLAQLVEIVSLEEDDEELDSEAIVDGSAIMKSCSSLLRARNMEDVQDKPIIEFSHFTVKEFLLGLKQDANSKFQKYSLVPEDAIQMELRKACLTYLCLENFAFNFPKTNEEANSLNENYTFRRYATLWMNHESDIHDKGCLRVLRKLFDPSKSQNFMCWAQEMILLCGDEVDYDFLIDSSTLHWACMIADPMLCRYLIELNENVNKSSRLGTPLQCAILGVEATQMACRVKYLRYRQCKSGCAEVIDLLLTAGANIDAVYSSPQQSKSSNPITTFSLAYKASHWKILTQVMQALLRGGVMCDRVTLMEASQEGNDEFFADIKLENLKAEDVTWFLEDYFHSTQQLAPAILTEVQDHVRPKDIFSEDMQTMLMIAAESGKDKVVLQLLDQYDVDVNFSRLSDGRTPLHFSAAGNQPTTIQLLLKLGADPLRIDKSQKTSLHLATHHSDGIAFQILLDTVQDCVCKDNSGLTPLHDAAYHGNTAVLTKLHEQLGDNNFKMLNDTLNQPSLIMCASRSGSLEALQCLFEILGYSEIERTFSDGSTPLHFAAEGSSLRVVQFFLDGGLDANSPKLDKSTALHVAAGACDAKGLNKRHIMETLLENGANIDAQRSDGATALSVLCESGPMQTKADLEALSLLLENKAYINTIDDKGRSPLHLMSLRLARWDGWDGWDEPWYHMPMYAYAILKLLRGGANAYLQDTNNLSPFQSLLQIWASQSMLYRDLPTDPFGVILKMLLYDGKKTAIDTLDFVGKQLLTLAVEENDEELTKALLSLSCDVDQRDRDQQKFNAIEQACVSGCSDELFLRMLQLSKTPRIRDQKHDGLGILHLAAANGCDELVTTLLDEGVDIEDRTTRSRHGTQTGSTALMLAIKIQKTSTMHLLLARSANKAATDDCGWTALHYGAACGNMDAMISLQQEELASTAEVLSDGLFEGKVHDVSPFHLAAYCGHHLILEHILNSHPDLSIDHGAQNNLNALHFASREGHVNTVEFLLTRGACIDMTDNWGYTSLHLATLSGHEETVRSLLKHGADPQKRTLGGMNSEVIALRYGHHNLVSVLHQSQAGQSGMPISLINFNPFRKLITNTAASSKDALITNDDPFPVSKNERLAGLSEALFYAIKSGDLGCCERLLDAGADVNCTAPHCRSCTALIYALQLKQPKIAELLTRRGAGNQVQTCNYHIVGEHESAKGYTPLHYAAAQGYTSVLELLLQHEQNGLETYAVMPLHLAAANGHLKCVASIVNNTRKLLAKRAPRLSLNSSFGNSMGVANEIRDPVSTVDNPQSMSQCGMTKIFEKGDFLNSVIDPREPNHTWRLTKYTITAIHPCGTALHQAVSNGHKLVASYLIEKGVEVARRDHKGWTALHLAALSGYRDIVRVLIRSGADVNCRTSTFETPLQIATQWGHIPVIEELSHSKVDFACRSFKRTSTVEAAIAHAQVDAVSCLMGFGQKIPQLFRQTCSPLCASLSHKSGSQSSLDLSLFLLDFTRNYSFYCDHHGSILIGGYDKWGPAIVKVLIERLKERGPQSTINGTEDWLLTALCLFASFGETELVEAMLDVGADINGFLEPYKTPLGVACAMGHLNTVRFLVNTGAETSWTLSNGQTRTAIEKAKHQQHVLLWLQDYEGRPANSCETPMGVYSKPYKEKRHINYPVTQECLDTMFRLVPVNPSRVRRRSSFIGDYALRGQEFRSGLFNEEACVHKPTSSARLPFVLKSDRDTYGRRVLPWDVRMLRKLDRVVYCLAVCGSRSVASPLRYSVYPLFSHAIRVSCDGPWEIF